MHEALLAIMRPLLALILLFAAAVSGRADALDTWMKVATVTNANFRQIIYTNGLFVAVSSMSNSTNHGAISVSSDGLNWSTTTYTLTSFTGVTYGKGLFVLSDIEANAPGSGLGLFSTNGINWSGIGGFGLNSVVFGNGRFAGIDSYFFPHPLVCVSSNGQDWIGYMTAGTTVPSLAFGNSVFVLLTTFSSNSVTETQTQTSTDATNWSAPGPAVFPSGAQSLTFVAGAFYATESDNGQIWRSPDGVSWTAIPGPVPSLCVPTSGTNQLFVALGSNGEISTSPDNSNWLLRPTGATNTFFGIAYGNGHFVAVSSGGSIFLSGSATPSLNVQNQSPSGVQLTITGGLGPTYRLQASADLTTWTNLTTFTNIGVSAQYLDTNAGNFTLRYYRTVSP